MSAEVKDRNVKQPGMDEEENIQDAASTPVTISAD
jgi:hypothetical protein